MLEGARQQLRADRVYQEEMVCVSYAHKVFCFMDHLQAWYERMRTRPIMTGAYLRPSLFNGPLPRLVPQPLHITGMITWRRKARERRMANHDVCQENLALLNAERHFERNLALAATAEGKQFSPIFADNPNGWRA